MAGATLRLESREEAENGFSLSYRQPERMSDSAVPRLCQPWETEQLARTRLAPTADTAMAHPGSTAPAGTCLSPWRGPNLPGSALHRRNSRRLCLIARPGLVRQAVRSGGGRWEIGACGAVLLCSRFRLEE